MGNYIWEMASARNQVKRKAHVGNVTVTSKAGIPQDELHTPFESKKIPGNKLSLSTALIVVQEKLPSMVLDLVRTTPHAAGHGVWRWLFVREAHHEAYSRKASPASHFVAGAEGIALSTEALGFGSGFWAQEGSGCRLYAWPLGMLRDGNELHGTNDEGMIAR